MKLLCLLFAIYFLTFTARIVFAPLMPAIQTELDLTKSQSGFVFLILSVGYFLGQLFSGFLSSRVSHRSTIATSCASVGVTLAIICITDSLAVRTLAVAGVGFSSGLYLPSAIATITTFVASNKWGKALAFHQSAPMLSFIVAPILSEAILKISGWKSILGLLGVLSSLTGILVFLFENGAHSKGQKGSHQTIKALLSDRDFWIMSIIFSIGIGSSMGVYSFLPAMLVSEQGFERDQANMYVAIARIAPIFCVILSGFVTDKLGAKLSLGILHLLISMCTILLGIISHPEVYILCIFFQQAVAASFFPPAFAALGKLGKPEVRNVVVSLVSSVGFLFGAGAVPALFGIFSDKYSYGKSMLFLGMTFLVGTSLIALLKNDESKQ